MKVKQIENLLFRKMTFGKNSLYILFPQSYSGATRSWLHTWHSPNISQQPPTRCHQPKAWENPQEHRVPHAFANLLALAHPLKHSNLKKQALHEIQKGIIFADHAWAESTAISDIHMLSTLRTDRSIRTYGRPCRALAGSSARRCYNHQTGGGLPAYNPINHLPDPLSSLPAAEKTLNLTAKLQSVALSHPAGAPLNDPWAVPSSSSSEGHEDGHNSAPSTMKPSKLELWLGTNLARGASCWHWCMRILWMPLSSRGFGEQCFHKSAD